MHALVSPVLLYGGEVWTIKKADQNKLDAFEVRCYRKVLNISWQEANDAVLAQEYLESPVLLETSSLA